MFEFIKSKFLKKSESAIPGELSSGKNIAARIKGIKLREQIYLIVSLIVILLIFFAFYKAIAFITGAIVKSFEIDEAAVQEQIIRFNVEDYEKIVPKLIKK